MSQNVWNTILPGSTSGTQLATILDNFKDAVISGMIGPTRPSEIDPGGTWVNNTTTTWILNMWSGVIDIPLFTINSLTGAATISSVDSAVTISRVSADSVGPLLKLIKSRIALNGQSSPGDSIGDLEFFAKTDAGLEEMLASISVVGTNSTTAIARGSYMSFKTTLTDASSLVERMRIRGDGVTEINDLVVNNAMTFLTANATTANVVTTNITTANIGNMVVSGASTLVSAVITGNANINNAIINHANFADSAAFVTAKGSAAAQGDSFYDTTKKALSIYSNGKWERLGASMDILKFGSLDFSTHVFSDTTFNEILNNSGSIVGDRLFLTNTTGNTFILYAGATGAEVARMQIPPAGFSEPIDINIPVNTRLSIKGDVAGVTINEGRLFFNLLG